mmetsp:Transcript_25251/g.70744  ORF Transcript_25251/g.70744 Transcript_25251/m.70744 type:complete len:245 (+) Transcript_25251:134-868(+)
MRNMYSRILATRRQSEDAACSLRRVRRTRSFFDDHCSVVAGRSDWIEHQSSLKCRGLAELCWQQFTQPLPRNVISSDLRLQQRVAAIVCVDADPVLCAGRALEEVDRDILQRIEACLFGCNRAHASSWCLGWRRCRCRACRDRCRCRVGCNRRRCRIGCDRRCAWDACNRHRCRVRCNRCRSWVTCNRRRCGIGCDRCRRRRLRGRTCDWRCGRHLRWRICHGRTSWIFRGCECRVQRRYVCER